MVKIVISWEDHSEKLLSLLENMIHVISPIGVFGIKF